MENRKQSEVLILGRRSGLPGESYNPEPFGTQQENTCLTSSLVISSAAWQNLRHVLFLNVQLALSVSAFS